MSTVSNTLVTARKRHSCESDHWRERHAIMPGDEYVRTVMFPGDVNSSGRPWVMRICVGCWRVHHELPTRTTAASDPQLEQVRQQLAKETA